MAGNDVEVPRGRMPELVLASYCCALLLRLSFVPLQSSSGLGSALYRHGAVLLTLGSTCTAASQAQQVCGLLGWSPIVCRCAFP